MTRAGANTLLLIAAVVWGVGNVAQKTALEDLGPLLTIGLECLIGVAVISPLVVYEARHARTALGCSLRRLSLASLTFSAALAFQGLAFCGTTVTNASFIIGTTVVFAPLFGWVLLGERPRPRVWPAVGMVLVGIALLGGEFMEPSLGDLSGLMAAMLFSLWMALVAQSSRRTDRPFAIAATQFGPAALLGVAVGGLTESVSIGALMNAGPELLYLGVLSIGLGFSLQLIAQRVTPVADAAIITSAECMFGALAAALLLGEQMSALARLGALLIMSAILIVQLPRATRNIVL